MKIASIADVKARFSAHIKELETGPLVITRNGRPVGVLLAVQDGDEIERLILGYTPRLRAILDPKGSEGSEATQPDRPRPKRRGAHKK
jgi:prevent-host-death family protein